MRRNQQVTIRDQFRLSLMILSLVTVSLVTAGLAMGDQIIVAPDGDDGQDGSLARPMATLTAALAKARPGDRILMRGGVYRWTGGRIDAQGTAESPITVAAYDGGTGPERVLIASARVLEPARWEKRGERYTQALPDSPKYGTAWLVGDGVDAVYPEACWPNVSNAPALRMPGDFAFADQVKTRVVVHDGKKASGATFTDAAAVLAKLPEGSLAGADMLALPHSLWFARQQRVTDNHGDGQTVRLETFSHDLKVARPNSRSAAYGTGTAYRLQGPIALLDQPGEWAIDGDQIVFAPPEGIDPRKTPLRLVVQSTLQLGKAQHLRLVDLAFEGVGVTFGPESSHCELRRVRLATIPGRGRPGLIIDGTGHRVLDSTLAWIDSWGVIFRPASSNCRYYNNVVREVGRLGGGGIALRGPGHVVEHTTVRGTGTQGIGMGLRSVGTRVLRCDVSYCGTIVSDIAGINSFDSGHFENAEVAWNRVHNIIAVTQKDKPRGERIAHTWHAGFGIRIDNGTPIRGIGSSGMRIHHNIIWNTSNGKTLALWALGKGAQGYDDAKVLVAHNSCDGPWLITQVNLRGPASWRGYQFVNNAVAAKIRHPKHFTDAKAGVRWESNVGERRGGLFADSDRGDFRPTGPKAAQLLDKGKPIEDLPHPTRGAAPDVGALEAGQSPWVAGALLRDRDLARLTITIEDDGHGQVTGLPMGRSFPEGSVVRIGDATHTITATYDDVTGVHHGRFTASAGADDSHASIILPKRQ